MAHISKHQKLNTRVKSKSSDQIPDNKQDKLLDIPQCVYIHKYHYLQYYYITTA